MAIEEEVKVNPEIGKEKGKNKIQDKEADKKRREDRGKISDIIILPDIRFKYIFNVG